MQTVLLLEDDLDLGAKLAEAIRRCGPLRVRTARTLDDALESIAAVTPLLIVAELELEKGSGLDLLPALAVREMKVPVIFLADNGDMRSQLPESSNHEVVQKPVDLVSFGKLVAASLERTQTMPPPTSVFSVADYLQLASLTRRSVSLTVCSDAVSQGRIVIEDGQTRWAGDERGEGVAAFQRMALLPQAEIRCEPYDLGSLAPNLFGSLDSLLLDAARCKDEEEQSQRRLAAVVTQPKEPASSPSPSAEPSDERISRVVPPVSPPARAAVEAPKPPLRRPFKPASSPSPSTEETARPTAKAPSTPSPTPPREEPARPTAKAAPATAKQTDEQPFESVPTRVKMYQRDLAKENKVNEKDAPRSDAGLSKLVAIPTLLMAARAESDGSVLQFEGEADAETSCAVAAFSANHVEDIATDLGLGEPLAWSVSAGTTNWYVVQGAAGFTLAMGERAKNPLAVLAKVAGQEGK